MFGSTALFWSGVLHFFVTPLAWIAVITLAIALVDAAESVIFLAITTAAITTFFTAEFIAMLPLNITLLEIAFIAAISAIGLMPSRVLASVIALVGGVATGIVVAMDNQDWGASLGASITLLILGSWLTAGLAQMQSMEKLSKIVFFARRIGGVLIVASFCAIAMFRIF